MKDIYSYTYKTRGNSDPHGKPKIYLAGCNTVNKSYFSAIEERLFDLYNAVIWQRNNQESVINMEELEQMQVLVFIITEQFLNCSGGIWYEEWKFALEHQIPILPVIIDDHLQKLFNTIFGNIQCYHYLDEFMNPECLKLTELLDDLLLNDNMREKILKTFEYSIFLSYRKKDISFVVSLMKAIHNCKDFWDVRIWYDAYLIPGRNFDDSIKNSLKNSDLMALLVTPSLLELPNYVHDPEYRIATETSLPVVPIEMLDTDMKILKEMYSGILCPVKGNDEEGINQLLRRYMPQKVKIASHERNDKQEIKHRYLVGLAYLYGIEMEVDHERGLGYIRMAADSKDVDACKQLVTMYRNGIGVKKDAPSAIEWQKKYISLLEDAVKKYNEKEALIKISIYTKKYREYIRAIWTLGDYYAEIFCYEDALISYQLMESEIKNLIQIDVGENSHHLLSVSYALRGDTFLSMGKLGDAQYCYENYLKNALTTYERFKTGTAKRDLSLAYHRLGDLCKEQRHLDKAYEYYEKYAKLLSVENGKGSAQEKRDLWLAYKNIAEIYRENGNEKRALELFEKAYEIAKVLADEQRTPNAYRDLSICLDRIGLIKSSRGDIRGAFECFEKSLVIRRKLLEDIKTTDARISLCVSLDYCGDCRLREQRYEDALAYYEEALCNRRELYKDSLDMKLGGSLATSLVKVGDIYLKKNQIADTKNCYEEALGIREDNYKKKPSHENRRNFAIACQRIGNLLYRLEEYESAIEYYEKNRTICNQILSYDNSHQAKRDYKVSIVKLAEVLEDFNRQERAIELFQEYYNLCTHMVNEYGNLSDYDDLAVACFNLGRYDDEQMMKRAYHLFSQLADQFPNDVRYSQSKEYIKNIMGL